MVASITAKKELKRVKPNFEERQRIKLIEDYVLDVFVALDSSSDIVTSLLKQYAMWDHGSNKMNKDEGGGPDLVHIALLDKLREIELYKLKLNSLHAKVKGTIQLVCQRTIKEIFCYYLFLHVLVIQSARSG